MDCFVAPLLAMTAFVTSSGNLHWVPHEGRSKRRGPPRSRSGPTICFWGEIAFRHWPIPLPSDEYPRRLRSAGSKPSLGHLCIVTRHRVRVVRLLHLRHAGGVFRQAVF